MRHLGQLYDRCLQTSPLLTKCITSAALFGVGDRIAQRIEASTQPDDRAIDTKEQHDNQESQAYIAIGSDIQRLGDINESTARTLRRMVWGGTIFAPALHQWLRFVDRAVPGTGKLTVVKKVVLDMIFVAPNITMGFFTTMGVMEGKSLEQAVRIAWEKLLPTLEVNWSFWPFVNVVVYGFVPISYRLLVMNFASLGYSVFLSNIASKKINDPERSDSGVGPEFREQRDAVRKSPEVVL